jgi:hypothetical protein
LYYKKKRKIKRVRRAAQQQMVRFLCAGGTNRDDRWRMNDTTVKTKNQQKKKGLQQVAQQHF